MTLLTGLSAVVGDSNVLTGGDAKPFLTDWTGQWSGGAAAVVRPSSTAEVSAVLRLAGELGVTVTVQGGNTSVSGGSVPARDDGVLLSLGRLNRIREIDVLARTATVDAGVVIQTLQEAVAAHDLDYPLMFGARGSAMIGGALATNAGGANVLRHGNARDLCLGIEAVLPSGEIVHGLTGLRKDNTGYDLKNLLIGSEGTLGIITGAVLKLVPSPKVRSTAFLALANMEATLEVLNRMQEGSGGLVEAFEWLPREMVGAIIATNPGLREPLDTPAETGVLVELVSTRPEDAATDSDGAVHLDSLMLGVVEDLMERAVVIDGFFATSEQQRIDLWTLREAVLETIQANGPFLSLDAALPLSKVAGFLDTAAEIAQAAQLRPMLVAHLGDGNVHYAVVAAEGRVWGDLDVTGFVRDLTDLLVAFGGSFSAEHGVGRGKVGTLEARKDPAQLGMMAAIKRGIDPNGTLNPGVLFADE
ncbi:FAD-binding oxidoreductase [Marinovum sp.]|uniref:FAD-binding oxidoreductase n=1 Tax=Marinovum sp. TaxID=2024839 RepID=UPI002B269EF3|nr:FAD-binding oxidoreductase [Marinovum sp.]